MQAIRPTDVNNPRRLRIYAPNDGAIGVALRIYLSNRGAIMMAQGLRTTGQRVPHYDWRNDREIAMKNRNVFAMWATGALIVFLLPAWANAQDRRVHVNFGGGPTMISDTLGDGFSTGWGPAIGVTFDINDRTAFQFEYAYRRFSLKDNLDSAAGAYDANHRTNQLDFNFVANLAPRQSRVRPFLVVGPGAYERQVEVTE